MTLFAVTFLLIYTLMHLMVWLGVRPLVPAGRRVRAGFATLAHPERWMERFMPNVYGAAA